MYISTNSISVFPLAKNRPNDRSARLFYENNVANLIRQVVDVEGFLISKENPVLSVSATAGSDNFTEINISIDRPLVFNLYGYYFSVGANAVIYKNEQFDAAVSNKIKQSLYAVLHIDSITNEIKGFDNVNREYEGLHISTDPNVGDSAGRHILKLLDFEASVDADGNWTVTSALCSESYQKISSYSLDMAINKIDGKH